MTPEELLLIDLCARLPYGVKVKCGSEILTFNANWLQMFQHHLDEIKPYLRPMSSMTEEEKEELYHYYCKEIADNLITPNLTWELRCCVSNSFGTDWLISHHFDYRGLIPMGLALEAPEGMYKTKSL